MNDKNQNIDFQHNPKKQNNKNDDNGPFFTDFIIQPC